MYFCFTDYVKAFDCGSQQTGKFLKELAVADHLTCLLRNLYAGQEATVSTGHGTKGWFKIEERTMSRLYIVIWLISLLCRVCHVKCRAGWIKLESRLPRNNNNLRYADDTTLVAESEEELKSLLMRVKEESEKAGLKLNIQKTKIMASGLITSWQIDGKTMETVTDFIFWAPKSLQMVTAAVKWTLEGKLWQT